MPEGAQKHSGGSVRVCANLLEFETDLLLPRKLRLDAAEAIFAYAPEVTRYLLRRTLLQHLSQR